MTKAKETPKRINPMTREEWQDFCTKTLHGAPLALTLFRIYATIDYLFEEVERLTTRIEKYEQRGGEER